MTTYDQPLRTACAAVLLSLTASLAGAQPAPTPAQAPAESRAEQVQITDRAVPPAPTPIPPPTPPASSRVPAQQAVGRSQLPTPSSNFNVRLARAPKMLGDFLGQTCGRTVAHNTGSLGSAGSLGAAASTGSLGTLASINSFATCDVAGRSRIQDNNSALPTDRIYFDYSYFHNAALTDDGIGVSRFAPGIEKTFGDGLGSIELRLPMAVTLNSQQTLGATPAIDQYEFGNASLIFKLALWQDRESVLAAGLGLSLPTADDLKVADGTGAPLVRIDNDSVHLVPYLAYLFTPQGGSDFLHAYLTLDLDANGNAVRTDQGFGFEQVGTLNDQNILSASIAYGNWFYEAPRSSNGIDALAWTTELHYTGTLNDGDTLSAGGFTLGDPDADLSVLNFTVGGHARYGETLFTAGYSVPLTNDKVFDGELRIMVNRMY